MEKNNESGLVHVNDLDSEDGDITHDISISQNRSTIQVHKISDGVTTTTVDAAHVTAVLQKTNEAMIDLLAEARNELANLGRGEEIESDDVRFAKV